jgi:mannan endo-1,4-beta-mannosidase
MNSGRYWWGKRPGPSGYPGLWRSIYDYYVQNLRLDTLLFVWSAEAGGSDPADFYPGHGMVDILGCDVYDQAPPDGFYPQERFERYRKMAGGRPVALTRCGPIPGNEVLVRQRWLWFMAQAAAWENHHRPEDVRILYSGDYLLHRNDWAEPHQAR